MDITLPDEWRSWPMHDPVQLREHRTTRPYAPGYAEDLERRRALILRSWEAERRRNALEALIREVLGT